MVTDWLDVVMIHYSVPPARLQPVVPFPLDTFAGAAYVTCVAFNMQNTRRTFCRREPRPPSDFPCPPGEGPPSTHRPPPNLLARLLRRMCDHPFFNLRTYVRVGREPGIYFLSEWLPRRLNVLVGPALFGLPYHRGRLTFANRGAGGTVSGKVETPGGRFDYRGVVDPAIRFRIAEAGSIDEFLMERYTAFTYWRGLHRLFRILHDPWPFAALHTTIADNSLLTTLAGAFDGAEYCHSVSSPGVSEVSIGWPHRLKSLENPE